MDYLTLCQETIGDTGIAGGNPDALDTVVGQTGRLADVVRYVKNATTEIDNLWRDWEYLWFEHTGTSLAAGDDELPLPTFAVQQWDRNSFYLDKFTSTPTRLRFEEYQDFRTRANALQTARPTLFTVLPSGVLRVNSLCDTTRAFQAEGWRRPVVLAADGDVPLMPANFHRIIVARAQIFYANRHDAPEVLEGAEAEYMDMLDKLQSDQCPSFKMERMSQQDIDLSTEVPGYQSAGALFPIR